MTSTWTPERGIARRARGLARLVVATSAPPGPDLQRASRPRGCAALLSTITRSGDRPPSNRVGQFRVIGDHGVHPDQDRVVAVAEAVRNRARFLGRDPSRFTACGCDPAIERCGELGRDKGKSGGDVLDVRLVQPLCVSLAESHLHSDACGAKRLDAPARDLRVWVEHGNNDPARRGGDQGVDAGRRAPVVGAGLEGHVDVRAAGILTGEAQGHDLGVGTARQPGGTRWRSPHPPGRSRSRPSDWGWSRSRPTLPPPARRPSAPRRRWARWSRSGRHPRG